VRYLIYILLSTITFAQVNKETIRTVLELQGEVNESKVERLYSLYLEKTSCNTNDFFLAYGLSAFSGVCLGSYESKNYGYTHIGFLPQFLQDWYRVENNSDKVFGKSFTWQKVFRDLDYIADRQAYQYWIRFFGDKWYLSFMAHWIVKNTFATLIRSKLKYDTYFYDFKLNLIF
jgi:hypothetical protein